MNSYVGKIITFPNPVLYENCKLVSVINTEIKSIVENMCEILKHTEHGVGLAANQIGILLRIIIVKRNDIVLPLINPAIISKNGKVETVESCLSVPGKFGIVIRSKNIQITGTTLENKKIIIAAHDNDAVVFQHEIDHLNGKLYFDKAKRMIDESDIKSYMEENDFGN